MPTSRTNASPLKRGFRADAERKSLFYRQELGLKKHDPLPALTLADHLKIRVLSPAEIPGITPDLLELLLETGKDVWSAAFFVRDEHKFIIHNTTHSSHRQESNLMHEIAHCICGHELMDLETALANCVLPLRKYNDEQEAEAECLGACLQLPQPALFHYFHILKKSPEEISQIFNASKQMVNYRLSVSGVKKIKWNR